MTPNALGDRLQVEIPVRRQQVDNNTSDGPETLQRIFNQRMKCRKKSAHVLIGMFIHNLESWLTTSQTSQGTLLFWSECLRDDVRATTLWSSANDDQYQRRVMNHSSLHTQVLLEGVQERLKELVELKEPAALNVTTSKKWKNVHVVKIDTDRCSSWTNDMSESSCILRFSIVCLQTQPWLIWEMAVQTLTGLERDPFRWEI